MDVLVPLSSNEFDMLVSQRILLFFVQIWDYLFNTDSDEAFRSASSHNYFY